MSQVKKICINQIEIIKIAKIMKSLFTSCFKQFKKIKNNKTTIKINKNCLNNSIKYYKMCQ